MKHDHSAACLLLAGALGSAALGRENEDLGSRIWHRHLFGSWPGLIAGEAVVPLLPYIRFGEGPFCSQIDRIFNLRAIREIGLVRELNSRECAGKPRSGVAIGSRYPHGSVRGVAVRIPALPVPRVRLVLNPVTGGNRPLLRMGWARQCGPTGAALWPPGASVPGQARARAELATSFAEQPEGQMEKPAPLGSARLGKLIPASARVITRHRGPRRLPLDGGPDVLDALDATLMIHRLVNSGRIRDGRERATETSYPPIPCHPFVLKRVTVDGQSRKNISRGPARRVRS